LASEYLVGLKVLSGGQEWSFVWGKPEVPGLAGVVIQ
jgi:hypothetical protein